MLTYTVESGDSLWEIANHFHISLKKLLSVNPHIKNPDMIHPGDTLTIPNGTTHPATGFSQILAPLQQLKDGVANIISHPQHKPTPSAMGPGVTGSGHGSGAGHPIAHPAGHLTTAHPAAAQGPATGHGSGSGYGNYPAGFQGPISPGTKPYPPGFQGPYAPAGHGSGHGSGGTSTAAKKPKATKSDTPPWLTLAYNEYMQWQPHLQDPDYASRIAWMEPKIQKYMAAGGLGSITEWCSCFVNWVLQHSLAKPSGKGFVLGTRHGLAASWAAWSGGKQVAPRRGAIVVKAGWANSWNDWKHVGFVMDWAGGKEIEEVTEYDQYSQQYIRAYYNVSVQILGGNQGHPNGYPMGWGNSAVTQSWQASGDGFLFLWPKWLP